MTDSMGKVVRFENAVVALAVPSPRDDTADSQAQPAARHPHSETSLPGQGVSQSTADDGVVGSAEQGAASAEVQSFLMNLLPLLVTCQVVLKVDINQALR